MMNFSDQIRNLIDEHEDLRRHISELKDDRLDLTFRQHTVKLIDILRSLQDEIEQKENFEAALKESEEKYRLIVEGANYSIACVDYDGKILFINNYASEKHGRDAEQIIGGSMRDLFCEADAPMLMANIRRVIDNDSPEILEDEITFNGTLRWYRSYIQPVGLNRDSGKAALIISHDITQLKLFESKLKESEEKYRLIVEGAGEPIFSVDADGTFHFMNTIAAAQLGGTPEQLVGKTMWQLFPKIHADRQAESIRAVIATDEPVTLEGPTTVKGLVRWYRTNLQPLSIQNGQIKLALVIANDITDRKQAEEDLKVSRERYRFLIDNLGASVTVFDVRGRLTLLNKHFADLMGATEKNLLGKTFDELFPPDTARIAKQRHMSLLKTGEQIETEDIFDVHGHKRCFWTIHTPIKDKSGAVTAIQLISHDITRRKIVESDLKESQARYKFLSDVAFEGIIVHESGKFIDANKNLIKMFGYSEYELQQKRNIDIIAPESRDEVMEIIRSRSERTYEAIGMKKDGTRINLLVQARNMDVNGRQCRVASIRDITAETRMKKELEEYKQKILESQRHAYINYTGSIVAHQLNQPLTVINMLLGQIKEDLSQGNCGISETIEQIDQCLYESDNAAKIMSKFRQSLNDPSWQIPQHVTLRDAAQKTISALRNRAQQADIDIAVSGLDDLPQIYINENALEQIFFILIQNSIEASDPERPNRLEIAGSQVGNSVTLTFRDDCGGIDPEHIDHIFEPFFTTKKDKQGMGLGLEIVQRIMVTSGGKIRINNTYGSGAEFIVTLPVKYYI